MTPRCRLVPLVAILVSSAIACAQSPHWWKGNLHTHSLWSDGNDFPESIAAQYREHGWHFLAFTEHNVIADRERWMKVDDVVRRGGRTALKDYRDRFGEAWVETREGKEQKLEVRLKRLGEFRGRFEAPGEFLLLQGEEITDAFEKRPIHINATNLATVIKPRGGSSVQRVIDRNLRAVEAQAESLGRTIVPHLNHPNFGFGVTAEDLAGVLRERFFEVYNGHPSVWHEGDPNHAGLEKLWDIACTLRIDRFKAPPPYGLATDDSHEYFVQHIAKSNSGRGWIFVRAAELRADALVDAMLRGDFYASSGVTLRDVRFDGDALVVAVEPVADETYEVAFVGTRESYDDVATPVVGEDRKAIPATWRYSDDVGEVFARCAGPSAAYVLRGDELYVRAIVTSSASPANPSFAGQKQQAWTQPVGWQRRVAHEPVELGAVDCGGTWRGELRGIDTDHAGSIFWSFTRDLVRTDATGRVVASVAIDGGIGDLCAHGDTVTALGLDASGASADRLSVRDGRTLALVREVPLRGVIDGGATSIAWTGGRFFVTGGVPPAMHVLDREYRVVERRELAQAPPSIRASCFGDQRFWFAAGGESPALLATDAALQPWASVPFDAAHGLCAISGGRFLVGECVPLDVGRYRGTAFVAEAQVSGGLVRIVD
ncbi:MAG: hypothetical protein HZB39_08885 [Planctomycetes bacterium]|nr:hypothetical protein [Planctomycetota bacterium]